MLDLEPLAYADGETALAGWLARPAGPPRAAVLVWPTIANPTPAIARRARMLADRGYLALVADFYGRPIPALTGPDAFDKIRAMADELRADVDVYRTRLRTGDAALRGLAGDLPLATIGYCMGGQAALELARDGADLRLAASFHGLLTTDRKAASRFPGKILVCHGDADPLAPRDHVIAFWEEMDAVGNDWHFHGYAGVKHGFTDPDSSSRGMPALGYDASADRQSWVSLLSLLDEVT